MRKQFIRFFVFVFIVFTWINVQAKDGIKNYYIEMVVLNNGDVLVKELFDLEGKYNGYEREIDFVNVSSLNHMYNSSGIEVLKVKGIETSNNYNDLFKDGDKFNLVKEYEANKGDYGKYTLFETATGVNLMIYNPSVKKRAFYVEYILKDVAIVHNDIAEIAWNIFSYKQREYIKNLEMFVHITDNKSELRVWGHGPLNGEVDIVGNQKLKYTITDLNPHNPIDIRFVFDKEVVFNSNKKSNLQALDNILKEEQRLADEANEIRKRAKKEMAQLQKLKIISEVIRTFWFLGLLPLLYFTYNKYDKEYEGMLKTKYFRDLPNDYKPPIVNYLMTRKIDTKELSATILNLIADKKIKYEERNKEFVLINVMSEEEIKNLTKYENAALKLVFNYKKESTLKDVNKRARSDYNNFLREWTTFKNSALKEAKKENLYKDNFKIKFLMIGYIILGLGLFIFIPGHSFSGYSLFFNIAYILILIISFIYIITFTKRTKEGNELYLKWKGLKSFLNDFGNFEARDLPHIELWEKYLVYAVVFGNARKLSKTMKIKFKELPESTYTTGDFIFDIYYFNSLSRLNNVLASNVQGAVRSALSTKTISETRSSSGGGYGGGFSGGGGSFGGGGGGGRF